MKPIRQSKQNENDYGTNKMVKCDTVARSLIHAHTSQIYFEFSATSNEIVVLLYRSTIANLSLCVSFNRTSQYIRNS